ncbi:MAG: TolC family protein, partial [Flavobacteriaceae bacterium]|nr:TolC family protein [Flavobacteriaceae bacterium]
ISIPTWFGLSLKGDYSVNDGVFLNPKDKLPTDGLYSAGISLDASEGLWINKRMATLKKAAIIINQTQAERDLLINELVTEASLAYFNWLLAYDNYQVNVQFRNNAAKRYEGVRQRALSGDIATIDTVESFTNVQQRTLSLSESEVNLVKARLEASNYLWGEDNIPLEISENSIPISVSDLEIDAFLGIENGGLDNFYLATHPKLNILEAKVGTLKIDRSLKRGSLFPDVTANFNVLQSNLDQITPLNTEQYKAGVKVQLPLFLRKERGDLKITALKLSDAQLDFNFESVRIQNKVSQSVQAQRALVEQLDLSTGLVTNYSKLLIGEQQKFNAGESSLFVVISREQKLIESKIKLNTTFNKYLTNKAVLFNAMGLVIPSLEP